MPGYNDRTSRKSRVRTWVDGIPLSSLDQLQSAVPADGPSHIQNNDASTVPLPGSEPPSASSEVQSEAAANGVMPLDQDSPSDAEHSDMNSSDVGSLWQIQHVDVPNEYQIPLPESTDGRSEQSPVGHIGGDLGAAFDTSGQTLPTLQSSTRDFLNERVNVLLSPDSHVDSRFTAQNSANMNNPFNFGDIYQLGQGNPDPFFGLGTMGRDQRAPHNLKLNYWQSTSPLMECLPHLKAICSENGRHKNVGSVTCIDYSTKRRRPIVYEKLSISQSGSRRTFTESLKELRTISNPRVTTRVLLVEDLSAGLIESLGSVFRIDPEVFAEHLNRSGYDGLDYEDELPTRWETHGMPKAHASLKWYRPVHENPQVTQWMKDPRSLVDRVYDETAKANNDRELPGLFESPGIQRSDTATSWMRTTMKGFPPPHGRSDWNNGTESSDRRRIPGSITWSDPLYRSNGSRDKQAMRHQAVIQTNIFRRSLPLSTRPASNKDVNESLLGWKFGPKARKDVRAFARAAHVVRKTSEDAWESEAVPTAWEEKATFFLYRKSSVPILILLLDPLPAITDFPKLVGPLRVNLETRSMNSSAAVQPGERPIDMGLPMVARIPRIFPRNKYNATVEDIDILKQDTTTLISTANVVREQRGNETPRWPSFRANPVLALLRVMQIDSKAFFQSLEWALDEISQDSLDDYLMSKRLEDWRRLMSEFEIEVPAIGKSLQEFISFVFDNDGGPKVPKEIQVIADEVQHDISRIRQRLIEAYAALRADMQFAESRRSINEAKTVTKLTELAFIFVPLSFTCSLFSMQVTELSGGVPVWTFAVTALGIAMLAYVIRLVLTSDFIADSSRSALEKFWARRGVRKGDHAPLLTLVLLTAQEVWRKTGEGSFAKTCLAICMSAFVVVPVAFMWTSTAMDIGFNIAITFFLVLSSLGLGMALFVGPGTIGERVTGWQGDSTSDISGAEVRNRLDVLA